MQKGISLCRHSSFKKARCAIPRITEVCFAWGKENRQNGF